MRILLVNDYGGLNGGAEKLMFGLCDGLQTRGHEARVLTSSAGLDLDGPIVDYRAHGTTSPFRTLLQTTNPWAASAFRRALRDFRPDVSSESVPDATLAVDSSRARATGV
jgi:hypothetical protein